MSEECNHLKVTVYSRMLFMATREEPAEYEFKIVCQECGEELDNTPEGSEEKEAYWEEEFEEE